MVEFLESGRHVGKPGEMLSQAIKKAQTRIFGIKGICTIGSSRNEETKQTTTFRTD